MLHDCLLAIGFFTRIPVPDHPNFSSEALGRSTLYLPLVGIIVGGIASLVYLVSIYFWPPAIAVILSMVVSLLITGGFHEDGLADTCDGLGGAFTKDKKLAIMKDSRLGAYGALALWSALSLKAFLLIELLPATSVLTLLLGHCFSRWGAMLAMVRLPYVREEASKSKSISQPLSIKRWLLSGLVSIPLLILAWPQATYLVIATLVVTLLWHRVLKRQIHGYTGDTIGASQQLNELAIYLVWLALL